MEMKAVKSMAVLLLVSIISLVLLTSCRPGSGQSDSADRVIGSSSSVLRIISGSENAELEPILEKFAEQEGIEIQMSYQGSLDIMRLLEGEEIDYDAVWPASSIWLTMGGYKTSGATYGICFHFSGGFRHTEKSCRGTGICGP